MAQLHGGVAMITGGSGASGIGHYYGKYGLDVLSQSNSMLVSPPDVAIEHLFPHTPPTRWRRWTNGFQY
jgi:aldehyde dehydrogenase (NAD+)